MTRADNRGGTAWTPGPWQAIKGVEASDERRCGVSAMRGDVGYLVATIENGAPGDFCDTEYANARLIAAAPELFEALNEAVCLIPANQQAALAKFSALLAKATGDAS